MIFWLDLAKPRVYSRFEVKDKTTDSTVSEGFTAPRGTPVAYATATPTARFPFI